MNTRGYIFDLKKFAVHDGPGIRTTVFLKGCLLRCQWCHNPESQVLEPEKIAVRGMRKCASITASEDPGVFGKAVSVEEVMTEIRKDVAFYDESGGGVTFSGGEPLMQPAFLSELLQACHKEEIHTAVDTSGYASWKTIRSILDKVNLFLYDLKLMDDAAHRKYIGVSNQLILKNLHRLHDAGANIFIRIPLIPGITDPGNNLSKVTAFVSTLPNIKLINLLPYNPIGESKYDRFKKNNHLGHLPMQSEKELKIIKNKFDSLPFEIKIGG
jgi:pyruvate formate lyase activating enzyme